MVRILLCIPAEVFRYFDSYAYYPHCLGNVIFILLKCTYIYIHIQIIYIYDEHKIYASYWCCLYLLDLNDELFGPQSNPSGRSLGRIVVKLTVLKWWVECSTKTKKNYGKCTGAGEKEVDIPFCRYVPLCMFDTDVQRKLIALGPRSKFPYQSSISCWFNSIRKAKSHLFRESKPSNYWNSAGWNPMVFLEIHRSSAPKLRCFFPGALRCRIGVKKSVRTVQLEGCRFPWWLGRVPSRSIFWRKPLSCNLLGLVTGYISHWNRWPWLVKLLGSKFMGTYMGEDPFF